MGIAQLIPPVFHFTMGMLALIYLNFQFSNDNNNISNSGFSTKTAYRYCGLEAFRDKYLDKLTSCQLVHVGALFRHGTRAPSKKDVKKFQDLFSRLLSSKGAVLPTGFSKKSIPFQHVREKSLLPRGFMEHRALGQFYRALLSAPSPSNDSMFKFYTSSVLRATLSAHSFYNGFFDLPVINSSLFSEYDEKQTSPPPPTPSSAPIVIADHLIRFYDYCRRYIDQIEKNKTSVLERDIFLKGPEMQSVLNDVVDRFRLDKDLFTTSDVYTIFLACAYEVAASLDVKTHSSWCKFLDSEQQPVVEYLADLKQYWLKSYAYKLNYLQSCPLLSAVLDGLAQAANLFHSSGFNFSDPQLVRGSFWFGHAESLLPLISALGLFNDSVGHSEPQNLLASGYEEWLSKASSRPPPPNMFRSGHLAPFAGHVELRLYFCPESAATSVHQTDSTSWTDGFFVQPLVNGKSVAWPLPSKMASTTFGSTVFPLSTVLNYFRTCAPPAYNNTAECKV